MKPSAVGVARLKPPGEESIAKMLLAKAKLEQSTRKQAEMSTDTENKEIAKEAHTSKNKAKNESNTVQNSTRITK